MDGEPLQVAVVDDEAAVRRGLLRLLRSASFRVEAFDSAASFLESLSRWTPQCLILDLWMPTMTGIELQQRLLQLNVMVPVVMITAYDEADTRERCLALGASSYLIKPIEGNDLLEAVRRAVGGHIDGHIDGQ